MKAAMFHGERYGTIFAVKPGKGKVESHLLEGEAGDGITADNSNWTFSGIAHSFDSHVEKSVPLYHEGHDLICKLSDFFIHRNSVVYDIGSSTGKLLCRMHDRTKPEKNVLFCGIEVEQEMIELAQSRSAPRNIQYRCESVLEANLDDASLITSYYTQQFIHPCVRQTVVDKIYRSLEWGGAFILFEKVRGPDARFQDIMSQIYTEYKLDVGYSEKEILSKARSLKGVLEPFSSAGNYDMLTRAGFTDIMVIMKYVCFEGFLAIK